MEAMMDAFTTGVPPSTLACFWILLHHDRDGADIVAAQKWVAQKFGLDERQLELLQHGTTTAKRTSRPPKPPVPSNEPPESLQAAEEKALQAVEALLREEEQEKVMQRDKAAGGGKGGKNGRKKGKGRATASASSSTKDTPMASDVAVKDSEDNGDVMVPPDDRPSSSTGLVVEEASAAADDGAPAALEGLVRVVNRRRKKKGKGKAAGLDTGPLPPMPADSYHVSSTASGPFQEGGLSRDDSSDSLGATADGGGSAGEGRDALVSKLIQQLEEARQRLAEASLQRASSSSSSLPPGRKEDCSICFGEHGHAAIMFIPCRHLCLCNHCYTSHKARHEQQMQTAKEQRSKGMDVPLPEFRCACCGEKAVFAGTRAEANMWINQPYTWQP
ncbi:unnamed protein product [Vitrella brassicaformis CCMP3155]|uniref:RING-type domain-containing protein n=1 Tax=Vitrella brassicaformis (strain CCMP3155) TaxID=1169540 RepID=A0A0G4EQZ6_VITBC|nr:unnamed protein product [Vitrella brassicaformis CCMP3155]|eukprot:CEL99680.1 unnamed protein product [Vitrella brassicaformis CCMP3155]